MLKNNIENNSGFSDAPERLGKGENEQKEAKKIAEVINDDRIDAKSDFEYFLIKNEENGNMIHIPKRKTISTVRGDKINDIEIKKYLESALYSLDNDTTIEEAIDILTKQEKEKEEKK